MKLGVAGVRLCDVGGCYDRWPCHRHGTLMAGVPEGSWNSCLDMSACPKCGYQCCGCPIPAEPAAWQPPAGWHYVPASRFSREFYSNDYIPAPYGFVFASDNGWACNADSVCWPDPAKAIQRAERLCGLSNLAEAANIIRDYCCEPTPPPSEELPEGWELRDGYLETYDRLGTDSVSGNLDGGWFLVRGGKSDYSRKFATRNAAMAAALSSANVCMTRWPDDQA